MFLASRVPPSVVRRISNVQFHSPMAKRALDYTTSRLAGRPLVIASGVARGKLMAGTQTNLGYRLGTTESHIQVVLAEQLHDGATFYDMGANVGFVTLVGATLVGETGRVPAFEPSADTGQRLRQNIELNALTNVTVVSAAVGDRLGNARLEAGDSSLDARVVQDGEGDEVQVLTVDHGVRDLGWPAPNVVKMDVEGSEAAALRGMASVLAEHRPTLMIEVHWTKSEVVPILQDHGYHVTSLGDVDVFASEDEVHGHILARHPFRDTGPVSTAFAGEGSKWRLGERLRRGKCV